MRSPPSTSSREPARSDRLLAGARSLLQGPAFWVLLTVLGAAQAALWLAGLPAEGAAASFALRALLLFALQAASVALLWNRSGGRALWLVLGFAVVFRAAAFTWPPDLSSDLYRYAWDGRVQMSGQSPYAAPPADPSLADLRDEAIWPRINRPEAVTVYPPGGQLAFLALAATGLDSIPGLKAVATLTELGALLLLVLILRRRRLPLGRLAIYAWSPLIISEVCVSAHLDTLVLPLMIGALLLAEERRWTTAGVLLGAAASLKLYPVLLLFALPWTSLRREALRRTVPAAAAVVAAAYALYASSAGLGVLGFLPEYVRTGEDFNPGLRGFLQDALAPVLAEARPVAMALCAATLVATLLLLARRPGEDPFRRGADIALAFVLLLPTAVHPWYALWLVPLAALRPSFAGLWLVGTLPLSYLKYGSPSGELPPWVPLLIWVPALAILFAQRVQKGSASVSGA